LILRLLRGSRMTSGLGGGLRGFRGDGWGFCNGLGGVGLG
jgi:hypothetical protein